MNIFLSLSPAPGITSNYLVVALYDASAPLAVVASQSFPAPHASPQNIEFTNLDPIVYIVITYESTDGTPSGVIRHQFIATPENQNSASRTDLFVTADATPGFTSGQNAYIDTTLSGWNYTVEQRGVGALVPGTDINILSSGGWQFINGYIIQPGEVFVMRFQPTITAQSSVSSTSSGKVYSDEIIVTGNIALDSSYLGKVVRCQGINPSFTITLPPSASSPNMKLIQFISEGGSHTMVNVATNGSDSFQWLGKTLTTLSLAQSEMIEMYNYNGIWRIKSSDGNFKTVGEIVSNFSKLEQNTLICNGQLISRTQYPRLWNWIQTALDPSLLVTDSQWGFQDTSTSSSTYGLYINKGKFSTGDGSTTFRLPVLAASTQFGAGGVTPFTIGGYLRGIDDSVRMPGTVEADKVGNFLALITKAFNARLLTTTNVPNNVLILGKTTDSQVIDYGNYSNLSPVAFSGQNQNSKTNNNETSPFNIGVYLCIKY